MSKQPILASDRLILRPFAIEDATVLTNLAGSKEIADTTISIPHPYRLVFGSLNIFGVKDLQPKQQKQS